MTYMAIDQYGRMYHDLGPHPRAALLRRLGRKHADRIYRDAKGPKEIICVKCSKI